MLFYDREGNTLTLDEWKESKDSLNNKVARTIMPDGKVVSTIHLMIDHSFSKAGPPVIFETMVFKSENDFSDMYCDRYSTEEDALEGHDEIVEKLSKGELELYGS